MNAVEKHSTNWSSATRWEGSSVCKYLKSLSSFSPPHFFQLVMGADWNKNGWITCFGKGIRIFTNPLRYITLVWMFLDFIIYLCLFDRYIDLLCFIILKSYIFLTHLFHCGNVSLNVWIKAVFSYSEILETMCQDLCGDEVLSQRTLWLQTSDDWDWRFSCAAKTIGYSCVKVGDFSSLMCCNYTFSP